MRKNIYRASAIAMSLALCLGLTTVPAVADDVKTAENTTVVETATENEESTDGFSLNFDMSDNNYDDTETRKEETVYVLTDANGDVQKIIVSDRIKNGESKDKLSDSTELDNIEVVKGDEKLVTTEDSTVWTANGEDVFYKGTSEKELPVDVAITYYLDGNEVTAKELAGKSGKVTIHFDYTNKQFEEVEVKGSNEKIYVPFLMMTGMVLDDECFKNVEVSNGRLVDDGAHTIVMGVAFPGMQDSLGLSRDKIEIPDSLEITADVTNFELATTMTLASNKMFSKLNDKEISSPDELKDSINELTDAMTQLIDGSSELYDGMVTLLEKTGELVDGINKLADGTKDLKDGSSKLCSGVNELQDGANKLCGGLSQLTANNSALTDGAATVFNTLLATATTQLNASGLNVPTLTISNYAATLNQVIASLDADAVYAQALSEVTKKVEENRPLIEASVTDTVRAGVEAKVTESVRANVEVAVTEAVYENVAATVISSATGMDADTYNNAVSAGLVDENTVELINAAIEAKMSSEEIAATIAQTTDAKMATDEILLTIAQNTDYQMTTEEVLNLIATNVDAYINQATNDAMQTPEVQALLQQASEGAQAVIGLKASLDSYNTFYTGLINYTSGVVAVAGGASALSNGIASLGAGAGALNNGIVALNEGANKLKENAPKLVEGIEKLKDGTEELNKGLNKFNEEGIQKISEAIDENLDNVVDRLNAIANVSANYNNYSGIDDNMDGEVKFIYRTAGIE